MPIDGTLMGTTTPSQSGPWSNGNEEVVLILQIFRTRALPSDGLLSYPGHSLGKSYLSAVMESAYSTALTDWAE